MHKIQLSWTYQKIEILIFPPFHVLRNSGQYNHEWGKLNHFCSTISWFEWVWLWSFSLKFWVQIFIIKINIRHIIVVDLCQWQLCRWVDLNWSMSIEDMKKDWVEAKNKNHFTVTRVGRSFCFCSLFLFPIFELAFYEHFLFSSMTSNEK